MAFASRRDGSNSVGHSYLDGIPVKISEKFRPPRKITLPLSYQHHYPVELLNEEYDFSLEKNVLEMAEMKRLSLEAAENAKTDKLGSAIEEFTRSGGDESNRGETSIGTKQETQIEDQNVAKDSRIEDQSRLKQNFESPKSNLGSEVSKSTSLLTSLEPNSMLQPIPSTVTVSDKPDVTMTCKLNLEDFEAESSPFDSMALKTLNDMEELKSVLQNANASENHDTVRHRDLQAMATQQNGVNYVNPANNGMAAQMTNSATALDSMSVSMSYSGHNLPIQSWNQPTMVSLNYKGEAVYLPLKSSPSDETNSQLLKSSHSTPDLLREIGSSLAAAREKKKVAATENKRPNSVGPVYSAEHDNNNEKTRSNADLKDDLQNLVTHITDMGFLRAHVLKAVHQFGSDDKKVIEHLCMMQTMIELGYDSEDAGAALIINNHNESQTKEYLRLLIQFRDLGFDDASIKNALQRFNNDRDKALDFLVS